MANPTLPLGLRPPSVITGTAIEFRGDADKLEDGTADVPKFACIISEFTCVATEVSRNVVEVVMLKTSMVLLILKIEADAARNSNSRL